MKNAEYFYNKYVQSVFMFEIIVVCVIRLSNYSNNVLHVYLEVQHTVCMLY